MFSTTRARRNRAHPCAVFLRAIPLFVFVSYTYITYIRLLETIVCEISSREPLTRRDLTSNKHTRAAATESVGVKVLCRVVGSSIRFFLRGIPDAYFDL